MDMLHFNFKENKGQTIIEAVIALSALILTLTAISVAITSSVSNSQFVKDQSAASKYAQDGMEYIKYLANNDPVTFNAKQSSQVYCLDLQNQFTIGGGGGCTVNVGSYKRQVEFTHNSGECGDGTKVIVSVLWSDGKCGSGQTYCHKSQLVSCFSNPTTSGTNL